LAGTAAAGKDKTPAWMCYHLPVVIRLLLALFRWLAVVTYYMAPGSSPRLPLLTMAVIGLV
jgi:hypothetical protein